MIKIGKHFAKKMSEVGKSAFDFQCFNHLIVGVVSYLLSFWIAFIIFPKTMDIRGYCLSICIFFGLFWEVYENILHPNAFFRVWGIDSLENSLVDIFCNTVGALITMIYSYFLDVIIMLSFITVIVFVSLMYITLRLTEKNE